MAQIFPRSANAFAKASIFVVLFLSAAGGYALWRLAHSGYVTRQGVVLEQPVPSESIMITPGTNGDVVPTGDVEEALPGGRGVVAGSVLGLTLHGVLESPDVVAALVGTRPTRVLEAVFDDLADLVEERLDVDALGRLAGVA